MLDSDRTIYRIAEPHKIRDTSLPIDGRITYTWDEYNCETLMVAPSGDIILVTKVQPDETPKMYTITADRFNQQGNVHLTEGNAA